MSPMAKGKIAEKNLYLREDDAVCVLTREENERCHVFDLGGSYLSVTSDVSEELLIVRTEPDKIALAKTIREDFLNNGWKIRRTDASAFAGTPKPKSPRASG